MINKEKIVYIGILILVVILGCFINTSLYESVNETNNIARAEGLSNESWQPETRDEHMRSEKGILANRVEVGINGCKGLGSSLVIEGYLKALKKDENLTIRLRGLPSYDIDTVMSDDEGNRYIAQEISLSNGKAHTDYLDIEILYDTVPKFIITYKNLPTKGGRLITDNIKKLSLKINLKDNTQRYEHCTFRNLQISK